MTKRRTHRVSYMPSRYIPASVRHRVFERDNYTCSFCGSQEDLTLDHYVALSLGGTHDESNLVTACRSCNSRKGKVGAAYVIHRLTAGKKKVGGGGGRKNGRGNAKGEKRPLCEGPSRRSLRP